MEASPGDRVVIKGHHIGQPDRDCEIFEVRVETGAPPYIVRWADTGDEAFPGPDTEVHNFEGHRD